MHHLRNHNQNNAQGGRDCGVPYLGYFGSQIPSTGTNGPAAIYSSLNLPADNGNEYSFQLTAWPSSGTLFMNEDTSFIYTPIANGTYTFTGYLIQNGIDLGSETITLQVGANVINCGLGNASAAGLTASVGGNEVINCGLGNASAVGDSASIQNSTLVNCGIGDSSATGNQASINVSINCGIGNSATAGLRAAVNVGITCSDGNASASGYSSSIVVGGNVSINCAVGNASAYGLSANVINGFVVRSGRIRSADSAVYTIRISESA